MARAQMREPAEEDQVVTEAVEDKEAPDAAPETPDGPLLDMSDVAVKRMIKLAKQRGYVTYDELNDVLPSEEVSSEQIEDTMAMLTEMGINVVESEGDTEEPVEEAEPAGLPVKVERAAEPIDRTDDPVRMYLREMGSVELLSREGEIAIAKRIEAGREAMIQGLCESPLTFQAIIIWRDELNEGKILLRDIIDLEATYAGPDAKNKQPVMSDEKLAEPKKPEPIKKPEPRRAMRRDDEYGDVLSPEDFDKPQVEEEDDEGDDDPGVSLSAMEAELKPQVLETFDRIAKTYKSLRKLQDQEVGEKTELSQSQSRRTRSCARRSSRTSNRCR